MRMCAFCGEAADRQEPGDHALCDRCRLNRSIVRWLVVALVVAFLYGATRTLQAALAEVFR